MKNIQIFVILFSFSCTNQTSKEADSKVEKQFDFKGISIFKKDSSIREIQKELDNKSVMYFMVKSDNEYLLAFDLPFECCSEREIMYLPTYNIGELFLNDVFLIFYNSKLALIRSTIIHDGYVPSNHPLSQFKEFFISKYGRGEHLYTDSTAGWSKIVIDRELLDNDKDTISMFFEKKVQKDSTFTIKPPENLGVIDINKIRDKFRKNPNGKKPEGKPLTKKDFVPLGPKVADKGNQKDDYIGFPQPYYITTTQLSFQMTFSNALQGCCTKIQDATKKAGQLKEEKYKKDVLKEL